MKNLDYLLCFNVEVTGGVSMLRAAGYSHFAAGYLIYCLEPAGVFFEILLNGL